MQRPCGSTTAVRVPHFCECSAGCAVPTPYWEHYCERHSQEAFVLELNALIEEGCPSCGLLAPEGSHLHYCSAVESALHHPAT